ncbi:uncharacterized protein LOC131073086 [Cryptomeria japonica]|uniref:uncharacterized protein LOC131073086 n=1 Tax=Cryptomeria japonica TaxID=3369 RepID=UPI0027DA76C5|nr:uncharacterized protein LOC131073086 [Cryptomeria japonica]
MILRAGRTSCPPLQPFDNSKCIRRLNTKWKPPNQDYTKLNFDGAARLGMAAEGRIIRSPTREMVIAYASNLNGFSSSQVEAMALAWGLYIALSIGFRAIAKEGDSKLIIDAIKGLNRIDWSIDIIIRDIFSLLFSFDSFLVSHIYREGNQVADAMTTLGLNGERLKCWRNYTSLPPSIRHLIEREINNVIPNGCELH